MKTNQKTFFVGIVLILLSVTGLIIGFAKKPAGEVTTKDVLIIYSLIALLIGIVIFCTSFVHTKTSIASTKANLNVVKLAQAALFAALAYIGFAYFRFDIPIGQTAFHLGNTFVVVGALLLGGVWGGLAGAVGLSIADLTSGVYVTSAPLTFLLKLCIGLITGLVAHKILKLSTQTDKNKVFVGSIISSICGLGFNVLADPVLGYFYKRFILGKEAALNLAKWTAMTTFVNAIASVIFAVVLYNALRPALIKANLFLRKN